MSDTVEDKGCCVAFRTDRKRPDFYLLHDDVGGTTELRVYLHLGGGTREFRTITMAETLSSVHERLCEWVSEKYGRPDLRL